MRVQGFLGFLFFVALTMPGAAEVRELDGSASPRNLGQGILGNQFPSLPVGIDLRSDGAIGVATVEWLVGPRSIAPSEWLRGVRLLEWDGEEWAELPSEGSEVAYFSL